MDALAKKSNKKKTYQGSLPSYGQHQSPSALIFMPISHARNSRTAAFVRLCECELTRRHNRTNDDIKRIKAGRSIYQFRIATGEKRIEALFVFGAHSKLS